MKTILKARWQGKRVTVKASPQYLPNGFNKSFRMKIKVEGTHLLPSRF